MNNTTLYPNTFQHHNAYVDVVSFFLTGNEEKVLNHVIREIIGFQNNSVTREAFISISILVNGKIKKDGDRFSWGCGLKEKTVRRILHTLCDFGFISRVGEATSKGQKYRLQLDWDKINWESLQARKEKNNERYREHMAHARGELPLLPGNTLLSGNTPVTEGEDGSGIRGKGGAGTAYHPKNPSTNPHETHNISELEKFFGPREGEPPVVSEKVDITDPAERAAYQEKLVNQRRARVQSEPWLTFDTLHKYTDRQGVSAISQRRVHWIIHERTGLRCLDGKAWSGWVDGLVRIFKEGAGNWKAIEAGIVAAWAYSDEYKPKTPQGFIKEVRKHLAIAEHKASSAANVDQSWVGERTLIE